MTRPVDSGVILIARIALAVLFLWGGVMKLLGYAGFVSYLHVRDNAELGGPLFHPTALLEFFGSQFGVFGPLFFAGLIANVAGAGPRELNDAINAGQLRQGLSDPQ